MRTAKQRFGIVLLVFLTLSAVAMGQPKPAAPRPNVVFILIDDLRWDALGVTGHPFVKTPNIDRIAKEGMIFRNAFVTTPLCSPSRASFLTGQYAHKHNIVGNEKPQVLNPLSFKLTTFPMLLQRAGYETAYVGKWHMGNDDAPRPGFDRWVSFKGQGAYNDPVINFDAKAERAPGYMTDLLSDYAVEFVKRRHAKPFMLYLAHKAIHGPFTPAERHKDLYADQTIKRAPNAQDTLEGKPMLRRTVGERPAARPGGGPNDELIRNQMRCLTSIDEGVGRVLKALEETGQLDNTVVIFTSDNGYFWGEHGLGDKRAAYEESIRVPLFIRYPKLIKSSGAGTTRDQAALNVDIAPTLLELAGASIPKEMHGRSLAPLFKDNPRKWRDAFLTEYFAEERFPNIASWQAVRAARWKYIHYTELDGSDELYDLKADPGEMKNLIADPGAQPALREMKRELQRLLKETR
jgi:N-acetylglucosamine-6-sulfatase